MRRLQAVPLLLMLLGSCAVRASGDGSGAGGLIFFFILIMFLVPLGVAIKVGGDRGQTGLAVVLTLALGWLGLAIFYFMTKDGAQAAIPTRNVSPPPAPPPPERTPTAEERLRSLDDLLNKGLITKAEHKRRRDAILNEI